MAHYHLSIKADSSKSGSGHFGYIVRQGKYSDRDDLVITKSNNMPEWARHNPQAFWEYADIYERSNGRKYREIEFSLNRELTPEQRIEVAERYIKNIVGDKHAYTYAIHNKIDENGNENPHVHFMFCERENDGIDRSPKQYFSRANRDEPEKGGARKAPYFSSYAFVWEARKEWTRTANHYFEEQGLGIRIDDRSYEARNIDLESTNSKIPYVKGDRNRLSEFRHKESDRLKEIQQRNGEKIINDPSIVLKALTSNNSTFTKNDLEAFIFRHTDGEDQYKKAYNSVIEHEQFAKIAGREFYTTKELYEVEKNIIERVRESNNKEAQRLDIKQVNIAESIIEKRTFNPEQEKAFNKLISNAEIVSVNGSAGTGKSYVLSAVNEAYTDQGKKVYGVALQGITAQSMQEDAGIESSTIASFIMQVESGKKELNKDSVIVLDEAGMVGSRDMQKLLKITQDSGAKIRMVGDSQQLSAVSAGNAYQTIQNELKLENQATLKEIMRQKNDVMNQASRDLSKHDIKSALDKYQDLGKIAEFETQEMAQNETVKGWYESNAESKLMLAYTNKDVTALNTKARELLKADGTLKDNDYLTQTEKGEILLSVNEEIVFKSNDKDLGVMNGTRGRVTSITTDTDGKAYLLGVETDNGKISVNLDKYKSITYGYATTIHSSQGLTVTEAHLLASDNMSANLAYVGMTRHKEDLKINYSKETYKDFESLKDRLSKSDQKSFSADFKLDESFDEIRKELTIDKRTAFIDKQQSKTEHKAPLSKEAEQILKQREEWLAKNAEKERKAPLTEAEKVLKMREEWLAKNAEKERKAPLTEAEKVLKMREEWLAENRGESMKQNNNVMTKEKESEQERLDSIKQAEAERVEALIKNRKEAEAKRAEAMREAKRNGGVLSRDEESKLRHLETPKENRTVEELDEISTLRAKEHQQIEFEINEANERTGLNDFKFKDLETMREVLKDYKSLQADPGQEEAQADPGQEEAQADPVQEEAQADPGQEEAQADPGQEEAQADPVQDKIENTTEREQLKQAENDLYSKERQEIMKRMAEAKQQQSTAKNQEIQKENRELTNKEKAQRMFEQYQASQKEREAQSNHSQDEREM